MTSSETRNIAEQIIEEIFELTDEDYLNHRIDGPIEEAEKSFEFDATDPVTHQALMRITGNFVRHIYEHGLGFSQIGQDPYGRSEALTILEEGYQSAHTTGYYGALLDASDPLQNGVDQVLTQIAEFIILRTRHRHIRWVYCSRFTSLDWATRCIIAEILLERLGPFLPPNISGCSPAQFADHIPELIEVLMSTDKKVSNILGTETVWISHEIDK